MKILHVIFSFNPDGAEAMLVDIVNEQSKTEQVKLIIINNIYNEALIKTIDERVDVFLIKRPPGSRNLFKIFRLNYEVFQFNPNVIHFHSHDAIGLIKVKRQAVTFLTIHGLQRPLTYLPRYDYLISISDAVKNDILSRGGLNSVLILNGIDFSRVRVKENYQSAIFKVVEVSRLFHEVKGQDILLQAVHNLVYNMSINNIQIDFIGEGPSLEYLENLTSQLTLGNYVSFPGRKERDYIYNNLYNYDLLVQPSRDEGFGLTIVEAIAAKVPVLISDLPGPMEVIGNGKYGHFFKSEDVLACAEAIKSIYTVKGSTHEINNLENCYRFGKGKFSILNTAHEYLNLYKNGMANKGKFA